MDKEIIKKYISGYASDKEKEQILIWAKADKENMKELLSLRKLYDITIWNRDIEIKEKRYTFKNKRLIIYRIASIAAILILLFQMGYIVTNKKQIPEIVMQTINVPAGQRVELILSDGTSVWLNAGSTFSFPTNFALSSREVTLDGEGYFNVKKDENKTFIVKTSSYNVKVHGTEFNIHAYSKSPLFEVSLLNGKVDVYSQDEKVSLEPNTRTYLHKNKLMKDHIGNYDNFLWKDGLIFFDDEPVESMVEKLELYFDTRIIVENNSFYSRKYTGKFRMKDGIEHILKVFQLKDKFTYEKNDENNIIIIR